MFGTPAAAPAASPGGFSFGGAATPAATTTSTPGFSFGGTPAAGGTGGANPFAGLGGSTGAPLTFGAAAATPAASATPAFGATTTPSFGALATPAASAAPAFGATTPLFGAPAASAAPAPLFGTGTLGAATPGTSSLFGTAPTSVPAPAPAPGLQLAQATTLMPEKEIVSLAAALDPNSSQYRFRHIFYNKVENPAQRVRPPGVDETQWREALEEVGGEQNAENLWPVLGSGFGALAERLKCDKEAHDANAEHLQQCARFLKQTQRVRETALKERLDALRGQHAVLSHRLLHLMRMLEALEGRMYRPGSLTRQETALALRLREQAAALQRMDAASLPRRVDALAAAARLRHSSVAGAAGGAPGVRARVDDDGLAALQSVLAQTNDALRSLTAIAKADARDAAILAWA